MTNADVAKAEQEGQLVFYCHENEAGTAGIMEGFNKDFPKIKTSYVRAQTGALYNKILSERSAGRFDVDVIQLSDLAPAFDFQKKGGYEHYVSPESSAYKKDHLSAPNGYFFWTGVDPAGIAYNTRRSRPRTRRRAGRTSSIRAGRARSAARSPRPACSSCSGTCCASSTVTGSGRNSPSCSRTPSIRACNCSTACQGRRHDHRDRRISGLHPVQEQGRQGRVCRAARRHGGDAAWLSARSTRRRIRKRPSCSSTGRCRSAARPGTRPIRTSTRLGAHRRAADADRREAHRFQVALSCRLGRVRVATATSPKEWNGMLGL